MDSVASIDGNYSTTKLLIKEKSVPEQKSEYKLEPKLFLLHNEKRKGEGGLRTNELFKKSYENKPLISIVTVVYNGEKHLEQTIKSVLEQGYNNVEYIIIDGGSTDRTLEIIKKYEDAIDYWVSEPDSGIYDAMNKGSSLCSGDYVAFLNADDWYNPDTIDLVSQAIKEKNNDYICGDVNIIDSVGSRHIMTMDVNIERYKTHMPMGHPALFIKRSCLLQLAFDNSFKIIADYDLVIRMIENKFSYTYTQKPLTNFRNGGISTEQRQLKEHFLLYYKHFGLFHAIRYSFFLFTKYGTAISNIIKKLHLLRKVLK